MTHNTCMRSRGNQPSAASGEQLGGGGGVKGLCSRANGAGDDRDEDGGVATPDLQRSRSHSHASHVSPGLSLDLNRHFSLKAGKKQNPQSPLICWNSSSMLFDSPFSTCCLLSLKSSMELPSYNNPCPQTCLLCFGSKSYIYLDIQLGLCVLCCRVDWAEHRCPQWSAIQAQLSVSMVLWHSSWMQTAALYKGFCSTPHHQTLTAPVKVNGRHL